jgi:hypothetical protein
MEFCELKIQTRRSVAETESQAIHVFYYAGHGCAGGKQNRIVVKNRCDDNGLDQVAYV